MFKAPEPNFYLSIIQSLPKTKDLGAYVTECGSREVQISINLLSLKELLRNYPVFDSELPFGYKSRVIFDEFIPILKMS